MRNNLQDGELDQLINANLDNFKNKNWHLKLKQDATVFDTINWCIAMARKCQNQEGVLRAIKASEAKTLEGFCRNLFYYLDKRVKYVNDPTGKEYIVSPDRLLRDRQGDCKKYTTFIAACLMKMGIPVWFKVVKYGNNFEHIYPIVPLKNGNYITMDVVYNKQSSGMGKYNREVKYRDAMLFNEKGNYMQLHALGNISQQAMNVGEGTQAAVAVAGCNAVDRPWRPSTDPMRYPMGGTTLGSIDQVLGMCDHLAAGAAPCRPGYAVGLGAIIKMSSNQWKNAIAQGDNWAFFLPLQANYNDLPENSKRKYDSLKEWVMGNTKKNTSFTAVRVDMDRGIVAKTGKSGNQHIQQMVADMKASLKGLRGEEEVNSDGTGMAQVDAIKSSEVGQTIDGYIKKAKDWFKSLLSPPGVLEGNLSSVNPDLMWTAADWAEALGANVAVRIHNLIRVGVNQDARLFFKGNDGKCHEIPTQEKDPYANPDNFRPGALFVKFAQELGKRAKFRLVNFTPATSCSPIGAPVPANLDEAVAFINNLGGIDAPTQPDVTLPPGYTPPPPGGGGNGGGGNGGGNGGGAAKGTALLIPAALAFALLS